MFWSPICHRSIDTANCWAPVTHWLHESEAFFDPENDWFVDVSERMWVKHNKNEGSWAWNMLITQTGRGEVNHLAGGLGSFCGHCLLSESTVVDTSASSTAAALWKELTRSFTRTKPDRCREAAEHTVRPCLGVHVCTHVCHMFCFKQRHYVFY